MEIGVLAPLLLQPEVGDALEFLHPIGLRDRAAKAGKNMHVVLYAADSDRRAFDVC